MLQICPRRFTATIKSLVNIVDLIAVNCNVYLALHSAIILCSRNNDKIIAL